MRFILFHLLCSVFVLVGFGLSATSFAGTGAPVSALKCEHLTNPIGIDALHPRLSWLMTDIKQGAAQSAYRLYIGTDSAGVATGKSVNWKSSKIVSSANLVTYNGKRLMPFTKYYWRVELWDQKWIAAGFIIHSQL